LREPTDMECAACGGEVVEDSHGSESTLVITFDVTDLQDSVHVLYCLIVSNGARKVAVAC